MLPHLLTKVKHSVRGLFEIHKLHKLKNLSEI